MKPGINEIKAKFGYKLIGSGKLRSVVARTVAIFPKKIINEVTRRCWFVGSFDDGWGFTLKADEFKKGECLIFLSDELLRESEGQMMHTIAHEIGHVILGHRNSIGKVQSKSEIKRQEKEADEFAKKYLKLAI